VEENPGAKILHAIPGSSDKMLLRPMRASGPGQPHLSFLGKRMTWTVPNILLTSMKIGWDRPEAIVLTSQNLGSRIFDTTVLTIPLTPSLPD